jgi:hypothetical protein
LRAQTDALTASASAETKAQNERQTSSRDAGARARGTASPQKMHCGGPCALRIADVCIAGMCIADVCIAGMCIADVCIAGM